MNPPARVIAAGVPAGCIGIFRPPEGDEAPPRSAQFRPRRRTRHRVRHTVVLDLILIFVSVAVAALTLLPGRFGQELVLTAKRSPLVAAALPTSPAAAAQVIAAYTAFVRALTAAEPQPQARAAAILAPYAAQPYLGHVLAQMAWYRAHDEVSWGYLIPHVTSVQITGGQAIVRDCQDAGNAWLVSTVTGRVIPGTVGYVRTYLIAVLVRGTDGRWRLALLAHVAGRCSPVPSPS
jgi:hypothetical protein